ncbi:hypothetical protein KDK88_05975, partial [bacterium]|nr:hypothetical protein [bacterium]
DDDRGFHPSHSRRQAKGTRPAAPADTTVWDAAGPGLTRLILFADLDGDSVLSALPDSSAVDTVTWTWEPFAVLDSLDVEPGRPLTVLLPALPDTVAPCLEAPPARPTPAVPDSLAAAPQDSLTTAPGDSLAAPAPQPEED